MAASPSSGSSYQPTLGSMLNPLEWIRGLSKARHPETREILSGFEGVVSPGEMLCEFSGFCLLKRDLKGLLLQWCLGVQELDAAHF